MTKLYSFIAIVICVRLLSFSQETSLTIDCQIPGSLSSLITSSEKESVVNLTVTGVINKTDLTFIKKLITNYTLYGKVDLGNTTLDVEDNKMPANCLSTQKSLKKFVFPQSVVSVAYPGCFGQTNIDTVVWTNTEVDELSLQYIARNFLVLPEELCSIVLDVGGFELMMPSTITRIRGLGTQSDLTIYSMIKNPQAIYARYEMYSYPGGYKYFAAIQNSTFYIPKGTMEKYLRSDFATLEVPVEMAGDYWRTKPNNNIFIEYYDIDSTLCDDEIIIYKGDTTIIQTQIFPDANLVSWINYTSNNPEIATVDSEGKIFGIDFGEAIITVTPYIFIDGLETKSATSHVKVISHPEGITMDSLLFIHIGEFKQLYARTLPLGITDNKIIYSCSDTTVATVSDDGLVTGISRGTCVITAKSIDGGYCAQCVVSVLLPVESINLEYHNIKLDVGNTECLYAYVIPTNADNKKIVWNSTDESVAHVDDDGNITAKKRGIAFVKATSEDNPLAVDSCKVTVNQQVTGVTLNHQKCELHRIGERLQLIATVLPDDASNKDVRWASSDESVCIVSNGTVVAIGYGTCVIIVTTVDGNYIATCTVTVVEGADLPGDVNRDGEVNVADINALIDIILGGTVDEETDTRADVNRDGEVNIADINAVIDIILNN